LVEYPADVEDDLSLGEKMEAHFQNPYGDWSGDILLNGVPDSFWSPNLFWSSEKQPFPLLIAGLEEASVQRHLGHPDLCPGAIGSSISCCGVTTPLEAEGLPALFALV
jgi:hypothetical protein